MSIDINEAIAVQFARNRETWLWLVEHNVSEGHLISASLWWLCPSPSAAVNLVRDLLPRITSVGEPVSDVDLDGDMAKARRQLGYPVAGQQELRASLSALDQLAEAMVRIGARHDADFGGCGVMLP